ncbi:MAG: SpoIID/LytB domain-containing protein [Candidatus Omnitrophota bacterium]|jgi:stage II sporulation protein D
MNKFPGSALIMITVFCSAAALCPAAAPEQKGREYKPPSSCEPYIRVAVLRNVDSIGLKVNGEFHIYDAATGRRLLQEKNARWTVTSGQKGISAGGHLFSAGGIIIRSRDRNEIYLNGRRFRGEMRLIGKNGSLLAVNYVGLEDYIKGIFIRESSHYWPPEVLKAEAIVFRSFALYRAAENSSRDYDVTCDVYSQVYGGMTAERYRTNKMVKDTEGMVLVYDGRIFPAYYHSACGGRTEDAAKLWNINLPPLKGVACGYCGESPHSRWSRTLSNKEVSSKLHAESSVGVPQITVITPGSRDASGRMEELTFSFEDGGTRTISAKEFRQLLGPDVIKSTDFEARLSGAGIIFEGAGWGHGVGLCQWGAYFMAKQGASYAQILSHYYPGTQIAELGSFKSGDSKAAGGRR